MEPIKNPYYPINHPKLFFSENFCRFCEPPENSVLRKDMLNSAASLITVKMKFIESQNEMMTKIIKEIPKDKSIDSVVKEYNVGKGITHLMHWEPRLKEVAAQALGLRGKILEANNDIEITKEKCNALFTELAKLKEDIKKVEDDLYIHLQEQMQYKLTVFSFKPQEEEMPKINPADGEKNPYVESSLIGLGEAVAFINIVCSNVFYGCITGINNSAH